MFWVSDASVVVVDIRSRSTSLDPSLAGMYFTSTNAHQFRLDLPDGVGTYRVRSAHIDALASQTTGWRFRDGSAGTNFASVSGATTSTQYRDITDALQTASSFAYASENYVEHTFTNDFLTVTRDTALAAGNGVLSAVWVEKVGTAPSGNFNPFHNAKFINKRFRSQRFG